MRTINPSPLLRTALLADAAVSGAVAVAQLAATDWLSGFLQLPRTLLFESGVFLVLYTAVLIVLARSTRLSWALVMAIVIGNVAWAVGCVGLLVAGMSSTIMGTAFVAVQVATVLLFAALEYRGLHASPSAAGVTAMAAQR